MIFGRSPDISMKISKSGQIINKFKNLLNSHINLFLTGNYMGFFSTFKKIDGFTYKSIKELYEKTKVYYQI